MFFDDDALAFLVEPIGVADIAQRESWRAS
jgi:hypothetical protein